MLEQQIELSIIIVNYNVKLMLEQCLISVMKASKGIAQEIIVIDNNSTDQSLEYLKAKFTNVNFIVNKENLGFSAANNQGIRISKGDYVLLLNPDTIVGENVLKESLEFMRNNPKAGAHSVKMLNANGQFLLESKRGFPSPWNSFCKMSGLSSLFPNSKTFSQYQLRYLSPDIPHKVDVLSGAYMFMRRKALDEVGLLDETFFMYGEDIDLSYRIVLGGYDNYYLPIRILHYKGESSKKGDMRYYRNFYGAMLIFFNKYYPKSGYLMSAIISSAIFILEFLAKCQSRLKGRKQFRTTIDNLYIITPTDKYTDQLNSKIITALNPKRTTIIERLENLENERTVHHVLFLDTTISYEDAFRFMDQFNRKGLTYYFYNSISGEIISPKQ